MFEKVFVEKEILQHPRTQLIIKKLNVKNITPIEKFDQVWGIVKKPYLQKRNNLNLFIAKKRGTLVKEAPPAYGALGSPHYYFIHAYNCLYECAYCYLQGYFNSPDLVFFINHEDILNEIENILKKHRTDEAIWFHAGEFSDSLALSHITDEIPLYFDFFSKHPQAFLEFRTKSGNVSPLLKCPSLPNVIISFSLSPQKQIKTYDLKTPPLKKRLKALKKTAEAGHPIGLHFDPIIYSPHIFEEYEQLLKEIFNTVPSTQIEYISLGVVRFTKDVYYQVQQNYPNLPIFYQELDTSFDKKVRYPRPFRMWILNKIRELCFEHLGDYEKIYLCMEIQ